MASLRHTLFPEIYLSMTPTVRIALLSLLSCLSFICAGAESAADSIQWDELDEVVVTGQSARQRIANPQIGAERLELSSLAKVPTMGGENDIIKSIALLPGVRSEGDGGGGFEVRGGTAAQNLVTLDGITLYNPAHVMGIFSTFNDQSLSGATLFKGPFPAIYGGATSSVLETTLFSGDMDRFHAGGTVGILAAKLYASGPVVKEKLSFAVTARRSYVDAFLQMIPKYRKTVMNFYDITAKVRWRPSEVHIIDGSFFMSRDNMAITNVMGMYWGNIGGSLSWSARPGDVVSSVLNLSLTHFDPKMNMSVMNLDQTMRTYIHTYSLNENLGFSINENNMIEAGVRSELLRVKSAEWDYGNNSEREIRALWENSAWISYNGRFGDIMEINSGIRFDASSVLHSTHLTEFTSVNSSAPDFSTRTYFDLQPRLSLKFNISPLHNIKAGFGTSVQNLHSVRSSMTSFPFDRFALTSASVKPERAVQYGLGYAGMTEEGGFDWSAEIYYKDIRHVYDYKDGVTAFSDINLEDLILGGKGRGWGLELMVRKNLGNLTGWLAYTLSRTQTKIPGINGGRWYDAINDRRHDVSLTASYRIGKRWNISASWIFSSGCPLTAPDVKYDISGITCYYYSVRNGYKTPPVHRLDLGATYTHVGKRLTYEWAFGVYNAYCRYNPYIVYFEDDPSKPSGTRAVQQAMYGLIPSVSYSLKF